MNKSAGGGGVAAVEVVEEGWGGKGWGKGRGGRGVE